MSKGGSDYTPGRTRVSKFAVGTGSQYPSTIGSTVFGDTTDDTHVFTGSVIISGSLTIAGGLTGSISSIASSTDNAIVRWDGATGTKIQNSGVIIDDSDNTLISASLEVTGSTVFGHDTTKTHVFKGNTFITGNLEASGSTRFGYDLTKTHIFTGSIYVTGNLDLTGSTLASTEIYGTLGDAADAIGVKIGSSNTYSTAGSKLLSVVNNTNEKAYIDYTGQMGLLFGANGGKMEFKMVTENLTMVTGATTDSAIQIPAGAICMSVAARVTTDFPMQDDSAVLAPSTFSIGTSTTAAKWGSGISTVAGAVNTTSSMMAGFEYFSSNTSIRITPAIWISSDVPAGTIRLSIRYIETTAPTS